MGKKTNCPYVSCCSQRLELHNLRTQLGILFPQPAHGLVNDVVESQKVSQRFRLNSLGLSEKSGTPPKSQ